ncbi:MAG: hypothetical protein Q9220_007277 [cf. Caloplaca sp. 1 TL-2023]
MLSHQGPRTFSRLVHISRPNGSSRTLRSFSHWHPQLKHSPQIRITPLRPLRSLPTLSRSQRRYKSFRTAARQLFREYPLSVSFATLSILASAFLLLYANYLYKSYIIGDFAAYPEPVAQKLRRALYYSNHDIQPENALKYYKQALQIAEQMNIDPLSDEILGVKFQLASFFEKQVHQPKLAIEVLERTRRQCVEWEEVETEAEGQHGKYRDWGKRTRVLGQTVRMSVKLGDLYSRADIMETEQAEESLVWAVTTLLKEQARRAKEGVKEGEGEWMNPEEIGGALESLATHYTSRSQHYLATPLYLHAISLIPPSNCHSVVLMNNLSTSLISSTRPSTPYDPPAPSDPSTFLTTAETWAQKALATASAIKPPERNQECEEGCAAAVYNLGRMAEMRGDRQEAGKRYREGRELSRSVGFGEGVRRGERAVRELREVEGGR